MGIHSRARPTIASLLVFKVFYAVNPIFIKIIILYKRTFGLYILHFTMYLPMALNETKIFFSCSFNVVKNLDKDDYVI